EAAEIIASAHQRVKDLDADTDRIWIERHRIVDDARELAQQLRVLAESAAERFPEVGPEETVAYPDEEPATEAIADQIEATTPFEPLDDAGDEGPDAISEEDRTREHRLTDEPANAPESDGGELVDDELTDDERADEKRDTRASGE